MEISDAHQIQKLLATLELGRAEVLSAERYPDTFMHMRMPLINCNQYEQCPLII